ncbi:hypothetical protein [Marimonas lutisalis]|uniref:hypothetical protein n=1 Tax=Marimonas lutisalis TaxID=2545756 RepID=UPI0010F654FC|nr:hypothetical protein [Marimonas lutisalis]
MALTLLSSPAVAQAIGRVDYFQLEKQLDGRVGFEILPQRAEPGFNLDAPLREGRVNIAQHFAGMAPAILTDRRGGRFDTAGARPPQAPLRARPGPPGSNLSVAYHRGLGSNALFPLGPAGFPALQARGEGAIAILFDHDQQATGFVLHTDYPAPLGTDSGPRGGVRVRFYTRDGRLLAIHDHTLPRGRSALGYAQTAAGPGIAGMLITNTDPGGIAIDDILYARLPPLG